MQADIISKTGNRSNSL